MAGELQCFNKKDTVESGKGGRAGAFLSPTACGRSPLAEGAKSDCHDPYKKGTPIKKACLRYQSLWVRASVVWSSGA